MTSKNGWDSASSADRRSSGSTVRRPCHINFCAITCSTALLGPARERRSFRPGPGPRDGVDKDLHDRAAFDVLAHWFFKSKRHYEDSLFPPLFHYPPPRWSKDQIDVQGYRYGFGFDPDSLLAHRPRPRRRKPPAPTKCSLSHSFFLVSFLLFPLS